MRAEDKTQELQVEQVEARRREFRALEHEQDLQEDLLLEEGPGPEQVADKYKRTIAVIEAIFRKDLSPLEGIEGFSIEEIEALKMLESAVKGRHYKSTHLVFAEDRRDLLEQALLVLYPTMAHGLESRFDDMRARHDSLLDRVGSLRDHIRGHEDAQEDYIDLLHDRREAEEEKADDKDDDDKPDADEKPYEPVYRAEDDETRR